MVKLGFISETSIPSLLASQDEQNNGVERNPSSGSISYSSTTTNNNRNQRSSSAKKRGQTPTDNTRIKGADNSSPREFPDDKPVICKFLSKFKDVYKRNQDSENTNGSLLSMSRNDCPWTTELREIMKTLSHIELEQKDSEMSDDGRSVSPPKNSGAAAPSSTSATDKKKAGKQQNPGQNVAALSKTIQTKRTALPSEPRLALEKDDPSPVDMCLASLSENLYIERYLLSFLDASSDWDS